MPIDMNGAAAAVDALESALSRQRGAAANWETATEYLPTGGGVGGGAAASDLELRSVVPLPPAFVAQYSSFQYKSFMGLFPEIGRAWLTADTRLFIWSYGEEAVLHGAPAADDFFSFDGFDQIIMSVALVRPRANVFIDDVQYLVAVATAVEVTLLGVAFSGNGSAGELTLIPTNISVPTDGVVMLSITGTPDGRVFMAGSDGNLHEFVYYGPPTGWASTLFGARAAKRARKVVHSSASLVNYVLPPKIKSWVSPVDELVDMTLDAECNSLFTLSASGTLSVYDICDDTSARLVRSLQVSDAAKPHLSYALPPAEREYIAIFSVPPHMSSAVQLVVVSSFGERIYFSTSATFFSGAAASMASLISGAPPATRAPAQSPLPGERAGNKRGAPDGTGYATAGQRLPRSTARPVTLKCVGYRGTPVRDISSPSQRPCVHLALWASGSVVMSDLRQGDHDRLLSVFPDPAAGRAGANQLGNAGAGGATGQGGGYGPGGSAPRSMLPPAGQSRPAELVHEMSLGAGAGGHAAGNGGEGFFGGDISAMTPTRVGAHGAGQQQYVHTFALAAVDQNRHSPSHDEDALATVPPMLEPSSMFWVLTSSAMRLYVRVHPKHRLASILSAANAGLDDYNLDAFFAHHGVVEGSSICLDLATSDPSIAASAARALYTHGGRSLSRPDRSVSGWLGQPSVEGGANGDATASSGLAGTPGRMSLFGLRRNQGASSHGARQSAGFDLGRPTQRPVAAALFSGVHDGICAFLARALRPIWNEYICSSRDPNAYQRMVISSSALDQCRNAICGVVAFLEQFDPDSMLPFDEDEGAGGGAAVTPARDSREISRTTGFGASAPRGANHDGAGTASTPGDPRMQGGRSIQDRLYGRNGLVRMRKSSEARRAEVGAIHNMKQLALRCSEALAFLLILNEHQLHRIVPALQAGMREEFVKMQFCDLVARSPGSTASAALIEMLFASFAAGGSDLGPLSKILQNRCQSYFDDDDMTLQTGMQRIRAASDLLGIGAYWDAEAAVNEDGQEPLMSPALDDITLAARGEVVELAEEAVQVLKPLSSRIYNIQSVTMQIARVGAVPAAIELALAIGDLADREGDYARASEAFDCVLKMVEPLIEESASAEGGVANFDAPGMAGGRDTSASPTGRSPGRGWGCGRRRGSRDLERRKDAAIRVAISSTSDRFHEMLYSFLMQSKAGERELLTRPSPRIDAYLRSQERNDLMWKYYAQHGRHAEAASVLVAMAEDHDETGTLVDRLGFLSRALHNAKTAVSYGDTKAAALETDIKDYMDVARVQMRLRDELARCQSSSPELEEMQSELDGKVLDLTVLYNEYALPYNLLESTLDILRCGSHRDDKQVRELWTRMVDNEIAESQVPALLEQRIVALGRDFYPSDVIFPTGFLVDLLERRTFERRRDPTWASVVGGWVSNALGQVGVPLGEIVDGYRGMIESNPHQAAAGGSALAWSDEESQMHAIRGAHWALSLWADKAVSGSGRADMERRMLVAESEKALRTIALCKSRLRGMSNAAAQSLVQQFDGIEAAISSPY
jgi:Nup133 N terminal like/Non-repetitive/WGA-negative nucleoporin C-terminal